MKSLICFLLAFTVLSPLCWAKNAQIMMLPTRVVMEQGDTFRVIVIKNVGDAAGDFTLELIDQKMLETGVVVPYAKDEKPEYSAIPYIQFSPRSMTLKPGEQQNVRLMLHKPADLKAGEYRSHVKVRVVNDDAEEPVNKSGKDAVISVKANLVIVIPVIVRTGETAVSMGIDQAKITHDAKGAAAVEMYLTREGNRSAMGDISVTYYPPGGGSSKVIKFFPGVAVYRPTTRRFVSVPLNETPKDVNLSTGRLGIVYAAQQKEGGKKLAETQLGLQ